MRVYADSLALPWCMHDVGDCLTPVPARSVIEALPVDAHRSLAQPNAAGLKNRIYHMLPFHLGLMR